MINFTLLKRLKGYLKKNRYPLNELLFNTATIIQWVPEMFSNHYNISDLKVNSHNNSPTCTQPADLNMHTVVNYKSMQFEKTLLIVSERFS